LPNPSSSNQYLLARVTCAVALAALTGGVLFAGPGLMLDRAARVSRLGSSRSAGSSGARLAASQLRGHFNPIAAEPPLLHTMIAGADVSRASSMPITAAALASRHWTRTVALQSGALAFSPPSPVSVERSLPFSPGRDPPTL
jgi:hypothetical protein